MSVSGGVSANTNVQKEWKNLNEISTIRASSVRTGDVLSATSRRGGDVYLGRQTPCADHNSSGYLGLSRARTKDCKDLLFVFYCVSIRFFFTFIHKDYV